MSEQQIAMDKLGEIVAEYTAYHGPISTEQIEVARATLRHDRDSAPATAHDARGQPGTTTNSDRKTL